MRGRVECSQLESISDGMETSMVIMDLDGSEISCDEWGYVSMLGGLCEDWCDVVMYCVFSTIQIPCDEPPTISMK